MAFSVGRLRSTFEEFDAFSDRFIKEHIAKKTVPSDGPDDDHTKDDFIDVLLRFQQDRSLDFEFSDDQLKAMIHDMFVARIETSLVTSEWLMVELVRNPKVMRKAQEEMRRVVGPKGKLDMKDLRHENMIN
ncbi:Cytochrome P450, E-class, group I [Parasponia andersonii]|uniref:Cytochrome P450, E-class, group I n=1 Tax=Parasponia andersonii TaxID=3476 RepID=A0A2P5C435_PARAD|nr:Cytochrome P450, E-class, group I [Parasponia andersonii]